MTTTWTKINKATSSWTVVPDISTAITIGGSPIAAGFFMFLTYPTTQGTTWTKIAKPTSSWTVIPKAT